MKEITGQVFSIAENNRPVPGCTVSRCINNSTMYFSLAKNTDISVEIFPNHKMLLVCDGDLNVYGRGLNENLKTGDMIITPKDSSVGMGSKNSAVYTEINIGENITMSDMINTGEVFELANLVPYSEGKIVNMDIVRNEKLKFVIMAFDGGTALSEHAAPGEAIIFALDGEGIISYEGKEFTIRAGENFCFAKGGMHSVRAETGFKMALLLTLE
ncbi:MAG: cupin domain-containing protein [Clostridia bacterium]|nr:cupin domain-containing protein [Clostridia bacterium]